MIDGFELLILILGIVLADKNDMKDELCQGGYIET